MVAAEEVFRIIDAMDWGEECAYFCSLERRNEIQKHVLAIASFYEGDDGLLCVRSERHLHCMDSFRRLIIHYRKKQIASLYSVVQLGPILQYLREISYLLKFLTNFFSCGKQPHLHYNRNEQKQQILDMISPMIRYVQLINDFLNKCMAVEVVRLKTGHMPPILCEALQKVEACYHEMPWIKGEDVESCMKNIQIVNVGFLKYEAGFLPSLMESVNGFLMMIMQVPVEEDVIFRIIDSMDWSEECILCCGDRRAAAKADLQAIFVFYNDDRTGLFRKNGQWGDMMREMVTHLRNRNDEFFNILPHVYISMRQAVYFLQFLFTYFSCNHQKHQHAKHNPNKEKILEMLTELSDLIDVINTFFRTVESSIDDAIAGIERYVNIHDFSTRRRLIEYSMVSQGEWESESRTIIREIPYLFEDLLVFLCSIIDPILDYTNLRIR